MEKAASEKEWRSWRTETVKSMRGTRGEAGQTSLKAPQPGRKERETSAQRAESWRRERPSPERQKVERSQAKG